MVDRIHHLRLMPFLLVATLGSGSVLTLEANSLFETFLFAQPGRMITVRHGSRLSMYCTGSGRPTIVLETGFGGGTAATWHKLQPRLGQLTRTCSYDRAGYGFSNLGQNLPRDPNHKVADLTELLERSDEPAPYLLVGHSNGGYIISAYARLHPGKVAGLVFLDAALALPGDPRNARSRPDATLSPELQRHLEQIRSCLTRAKAGIVPAEGDSCVAPNWYSSFPPALVRSEIANRSKADFWRAYLSEAENNYTGASSRQAWRLLPHRWERIPVRVFVASVGSMSDQQAVGAFKLEPGDKAGLAQARSNRAKWEERQTQICKLTRDCAVVRIPTANHLVHNAAPDQVMEYMTRLVNQIRDTRGPSTFR